MGLSVSVTSQCSIETDERIGLVFGMGASSTYLTLCCKAIQVTSKMVLPSGT